jgi:DNA-binding NarL/FixJ family response regulator
VLDLLQRGLQNKEIAEELSISAKTVKFHVSNILAKCQMSNRSALIACTRARKF